MNKIDPYLQRTLRIDLHVNKELQKRQEIVESNSFLRNIRENFIKTMMKFHKDYDEN